MAVLDVRPAKDCTFDLVSLGEVMQRLGPGDARVRMARTFAVCESGGEYSNISSIATTLREVQSATVNGWGAIAWTRDGFVESTNRPDLEILDSVCGGDSFASGYIYGLMMGRDAQIAVEHGAAHDALAMTTSRDTSMANLSEVEALVAGSSARVQH